MPGKQRFFNHDEINYEELSFDRAAGANNSEDDDLFDTAENSSDGAESDKQQSKEQSDEELEESLKLSPREVKALVWTGIASIVDFFVIATGTSRRQMHAIADEVNRKIKGEGGNDRLSIEGYRTEGHWILMDFGDVVLHVFTEEGRELYDLENLKADATRIDWQNMQDS